ncbi:RSP_2648 family PIN domain-containing protein [Cognatiyoonia sp.]|uniref:RSP_2648 family PIN domain-containing protein n=1 Tax=Cognatiyoonia sp. TaxID=2211652 RepID=UPI003F69DA4B
MRVLIDACVLYPTVLREVVLGCANMGVFEPKWSDRILEEWVRATHKLGPEAETIARGEVALLSAQFPSAMVPAHEGLEQRFWLPDPNDVHVLASAVAGSCDAIMTLNAKDFPRNILAEEGVSRVDPDGFLIGFLENHNVDIRAVCEGVLATAREMSGEDWTMRKLLKKALLPRLGKALA